jgi:hypothetical protein
MERQINRSDPYFSAHCTLVFCHDDEIIMTFSLNKQLTTERQINRSDPYFSAHTRCNIV